MSGGGFIWVFLVTRTENIPIAGSVFIEESEDFMSKCVWLSYVYFPKDYFMLSSTLNSYLKAKVIGWKTISWSESRQVIYVLFLKTWFLDMGSKTLAEMKSVVGFGKRVTWPHTLPQVIHSPETWKILAWNCSGQKTKKDNAKIKKLKTEKRTHVPYHPSSAKSPVTLRAILKSLSQTPWHGSQGCSIEPMLPAWCFLCMI